MKPSVAIAKSKTPNYFLDLDIQDLRDHPQHLPAITRLHHRHWHHQYGKNSDRNPSLEERQSKLADHMSDGQLPVTWLAFQKGSLVGSVSLVEYSAAGSTVKSAWVANLFVPEEKRERGIGGALLQHATGQARLLGLDQIYLFTASHQAFYQQRCWQWLQHQRVQGELVDVLYYPLKVLSGRHLAC